MVHSVRNRELGESIPMFTHRVRILGLLFFTALVLILGRVIHLQFGLGPYHRAMMAESEVRTRLIRAPRGSIITSDGTVLAVDRCDADLSVHYRYLERPLNEAWLARQARARLSRKERLDPGRVNEAIDQFRREVLAMWPALGELTNIPETELDRRAATIQQRVDRIVESVNRRRLEHWENRSDREPVEGLQERDQPSFRHSDQFVENTFLLAAFQRFCRWLADEPARPSTPVRPVPIPVVEQDRYFTIVENISPNVLLEFTSNPERFPGVQLDQRIRRVYPQRDLACAVVGYTEPGVGNDRFDSATLSSGTGLTGVEGYYNDLLEGQPGRVRERTVQQGGIPQVLGGRAPRPGQDITLTLDLRLQQFAEEALDAARDRAADPAHHSGPASSGALIALDANTGAVLVAAATPRFDLNLAAQPATEQARELIARRDSPLFNRLVQMTLAPGSVFKPVVAVAGLKSGVDPHETYFCRGYLHRPDKFRCLIYRSAGVGHDTIAMQEALARSCNVYFFQLAERVGTDALVHWGEAFGFGQRTGMDLAGEQAGSLTRSQFASDTRTARQSNRRSFVSPAGRRSDADALGLAIGQGTIEATPLQVAVMMAAVANGGLRVWPHVRRDAFQPPRPIDGIDLFRDRALSEVRQGLERVVADSRGTGHEQVYLSDIAIAGKTGTAQSGSPLGDHAWFAGYAPAKKPRVVVVVALEHAGSGAHAAGPLARDLIRRIGELGYFNDAEPMAVVGSR